MADLTNLPIDRRTIFLGRELTNVNIVLGILLISRLLHTAVKLLSHQTISVIMLKLRCLIATLPC